MSQSTTDIDEEKEPVVGEPEPESDETGPAPDSEDPDIEEDLFEEELRIDGICGVY